MDNVSFKIIGTGTGLKYLKNYLKKNNIRNTQIINYLPKDSYFRELEKADVGLIFLNEKFTIPNFPSRLLDYLYFDLFILSNTDINTDITDFINNENVGKCFYGIRDLDKMILEIKKIKDHPTYLKSVSQNSNKSLINNFNVDISFELIKNKLNGKKNLLA